jgi:hypothetical protein
MNQRLHQQINFVVEIDRLKGVLRQTRLMDGSRRENSAEHSWHLALMALTLADYAPAGVNLQRAIQQVLIHDLVEIDAGDTFCYDQAAHQDKAEREQQAAERIFGLLPAPRGINCGSFGKNLKPRRLLPLVLRRLWIACNPCCITGKPREEPGGNTISSAIR